MRDGDGDIDYSKYTLLELEEALDGIDRVRYPRNYAKLCSLHEQLKPAAAAAAQPEHNDTTDNTIDRVLADRFAVGIAFNSDRHSAGVAQCALVGCCADYRRQCFCFQHGYA